MSFWVECAGLLQMIVSIWKQDCKLDFVVEDITTLEMHLLLFIPSYVFVFFFFFSKRQRYNVALLAMHGSSYLLLMDLPERDGGSG